MKILRLSGILIILCFFGDTEGSINCNGLLFDGKYYDKEILIDGIEVVGQLSLDRKNNLLFFSYNSFDYETLTNSIKSAYFDVKTKEMYNIDLHGVIASVYDDRYNTMYLGSDEGIYIFNLSEKKTEFLALKTTNIWSLHLWDKLYFTEYPSNNVFALDNGKYQLVDALRDSYIKFSVKTTDGIYIVNDTGLYYLTDDFHVAYTYSTDDAYRFMAKDLDDNVYVGRKEMANENNIHIDVYRVNKRERNIEKVSTIEDSIHSMVFDRDNNIILVEADKIIKLTANPNKHECKLLREVTGI